MEPGREPKSVLRAVLGAVALLSSLVVLPVLIELFGRAQPVAAESRLSTSDAA